MIDQTEAPKVIEDDDAGPYIEPDDDDRRWWSEQADDGPDDDDEAWDRRAAEAEWLDSHERGLAAV